MNTLYLDFANKDYFLTVKSFFILAKWGMNAVTSTCPSQNGYEHILQGDKFDFIWEWFLQYLSDIETFEKFSAQIKHI